MRSLFALLLFSTSAFAQQSRITGRVLDKDGMPVRDVEVILHAITEQKGTELDRDTSNADGSFQVDSGSLDPDAVYFVAVVWRNELYMGRLMRPPFRRDQEYVVRLGVDPVNLDPEAALPAVRAEPAGNDRKAGAAVIIIAGFVIGGLIYFWKTSRPLARRRWLVELARLEDELTADPDPRGVLTRRKEELRKRLKAPARR